MRRRSELKIQETSGSLLDALRPSGEDIMKAQRTLIAALIALASVPALAAAKFDVYT